MRFCVQIINRQNLQCGFALFQIREIRVNIRKIFFRIIVARGGETFFGESDLIFEEEEQYNGRDNDKRSQKEHIFESFLVSDKKSKNSVNKGVRFSKEPFSLFFF